MRRLRTRVIKLLAFVLMILLLLVQSGCWSIKEIKNMAIVMGVGIDKPPGSSEIDQVAPGEDAHQVARLVHHHDGAHPQVVHGPAGLLHGGRRRQGDGIAADDIGHAKLRWHDTSLATGPGIAA